MDSFEMDSNRSETGLDQFNRIKWLVMDCNGLKWIVRD